MTRSNIFDRLSFISLFLSVILLPVFFLPFTNIPIEVGKGFLLVLGLTLCVIFWGLARFADGQITFPRSSLLFSGLVISIVFLLSAFFSSASSVSFFGTMFDVGTFWFIFAGFLLMLLSSIIFRDPKNARIVLFGAILSSFALLLFQAIHLFVPDALSLGVLSGKTGNLLGSWNAFGIFAGFSTLVSLLVVEFFPTTRMEKLLLQILVGFSLILVAAVNFPFVWELIGISALIIFVYKVSSNHHKAEGEKIFPVLSFIIIMIALLFFISGNFVGGVLPSRLGLSNNEVSPSLRATMSVTWSALKANPMLGIGPNRFGEIWASYKPLPVNATNFWDVSFNSGSGLLPSLVATTGALGILSWLVFFVLFISAGMRSIFSSIKHGVNWETMAFFVLSLYLFISSFFYSVGSVIFLLALAFAGIFAGLSASHSANEEISISFLNDHRKSFFSMMFIVILLIVSAATAFKFVERVASISYFGKAVTATEIVAAETSIGKALALYQNDLYLRTYAQVYLAKLNSIATKEGESLSDEDKATLQTSLDQAVNGAQLATTYNPKNYLNFQMLGSVYQALASVGVKDAYSKAIEAYKTASTLNPNNPGIKLAMASASMALKNNQDAKDYANAAIALKADYIDAFIVLSQIAKSEGDNAGALSYAQTALSFAPANKDLIKFVDSIKNPSTTTAATSPTTSKPKQ